MGASREPMWKKYYFAILLSRETFLDIIMSYAFIIIIKYNLIIKSDTEKTKERIDRA